MGGKISKREAGMLSSVLVGEMRGLWGREVVMLLWLVSLSGVMVVEVGGR